MKLLIGTLIFGSVTLIIIALSMILKKGTDISKFSANWEGDSSSTNAPKKIKKRSKFKPTVLLLSIAGSVTGYIILMLVTGIPTASIFGLFLGFVVPKILSDSYEKKQRHLTTLQLEKSSEIMASVLRSGSGIVEALVRASSEIPNPLRSELVATANEIKLGVSNAVAFENLAQRVQYDELNILSMAINLQQDGMAVNLALLLSQIQESIRHKIAFQRDVDVMTAENKMAAWVVSALPFATLAIFRLIMPDMVAPLFNNIIGLSIFGTCLILIIIGLFWLMKIAQIDV